MRTILLLTGVGLVFASVAGCGDDTTRGVVTNAWHQPSNVIGSESYCASRKVVTEVTGGTKSKPKARKVKRCVRYATRLKWSEEMWRLEVRDTGGDLVFVRVDPGDYSGCPIGSRYPDCTED